MLGAPLKFPERMYQKCPLCDERHPMNVYGYVHNIQDGKKLVPSGDMGYSFCNCMNIWYTNWRNIDQTVYNAEYKSKYQSPLIDQLFRNYAKVYLPILKEHNPGMANFADVGAINPSLLDAMHENGLKTFALDIDTAVNYERHETIIGDLEDLATSEKLVSCAGKLDCIWMSHVFEHLHYPRTAAQVISNILNDGGLLFIAMPDPFQINWNQPALWGHWHLREHHILWDMDSFIEFMSDFGLQCVFKQRNVMPGTFICKGDYHLIFKKVNK